MLLLFIPLIIWILIILIDHALTGGYTWWTYGSSIIAALFVLAAIVRAFYNWWSEKGKAPRP